MFYCPGEYCSKKDTCQYHYTEGLVQLLDLSRTGWGAGGFDRDGNYSYYHEYNCGDLAKEYYSYKEKEDASNNKIS